MPAFVFCDVGLELFPASARPDASQRCCSAGAHSPLLPACNHSLCMLGQQASCRDSCCYESLCVHCLTSSHAFWDILQTRVHTRCLGQSCVGQLALLSLSLNHISAHHVLCGRCQSWPNVAKGSVARPIGVATWHHHLYISCAETSFALHVTRFPLSPQLTPVTVVQSPVRPTQRHNNHAI